MTVPSPTPPSWPAHGPPPPPSGGGRQPSGRTVLIVAAVGLVAFMAAATAAFAATGGFTGDAAEEQPAEPAEAASPGGGLGEPVDCGEGQRCIPSVTIADVVDTLTARGYECQDTLPGLHGCWVQIGDNRCEVRLAFAAADENKLIGVAGSFTTDEDERSPGGVSCVTWAGSIPFAGDPEAIATISRLVSQSQQGASVDTEIGGYQVNLDRELERSVFLSVFVPDNPPTPVDPLPPPAPLPPPPEGLDLEDAEQ